MKKKFRANIILVGLGMMAIVFALISLSLFLSLKNRLGDRFENSPPDISAWKTYSSEEYGFSFKYPEEWGEIIVNTHKADENQVGTKTTLTFSIDQFRTSNEKLAPTFVVKTVGYGFLKSTNEENLEDDFRFSEIGLNLSAEQLSGLLEKDATANVTVEQVVSNDLNGIKMKGTGKNLAHETIEGVAYVFPRFNTTKTLNLKIFGGMELERTLQEVVQSITIANTVNEEISIISPFPQAPDIDTTNWQKYTNEELGVSFLYPDYWEIQEDPWRTNDNRESFGIKDSERGHQYTRAVLDWDNYDARSSKSTIEEWCKAASDQSVTVRCR